MQAPLTPTNESPRLDRLHDYGILDTASERSFDEMVRMASLICDVPIAQISLIDKNRQWFKAAIGLVDVKEIPRDISFGGHVVHESRMLIVNDAATDPRFHDNPLVTDGPKIRFYAGTPLVDRDGFTLGSLCVIDSQPRELTEKQRELLELLGRQVMALIELRIRNRDVAEAEHRLRQIAETIEDSFWITSLDSSEILYVNPAYERIWGRTIQSLYAQPNSLTEAIHPEDRRAVFAAMERLAEGSCYDIHYRVIRPDGTERIVRDRAHNIYDVSGVRYRSCSIVSDVTDQVAAEKKIEAQRAALLMGSKMTALGEMSAGIAHEINNPVAIIHAKAAQLRERALGQLSTHAEVADTAHKIEFTAERISRIVKSLRAFVHEGQSDLMESHSLRGIVCDTLEFCWERFKNERIDLRVDLPDTDLSLLCNPVQISQVILNLLNNSHDAVLSQKSGRWVEVNVKRDGDFVLVGVVDSGGLMPPEVAHKLFAPFFTTKPAGVGTGLGLSVSRSLAEKHGGTLTYRAEEGMNYFKIRLPLAPGV